ncbi:MAG: MMPL family transporter [Spirochaetaceae bacterium]|nr:MAG: MMPL family transporter [Spirochaetaceae bacterium]
MTGISKFIVAKARWVVIAVLLLTLLAIVSLRKAEFDPSVYSFFRIGESYSESFFELKDKYGGTDLIQVIVSAEGRITAEQTLTQVWSYYEKLRDVEGISSALCFIPPFLPGSSRLVPTSQKLLSESYQAVAPVLESRQTMLGALLSEDLTTGAFQLRIAGEADPFRVLRELRSIEQPSGLDVRFAGSQIIFETLWKSQRNIVAILSPIAIIILFAVFSLNIKSVRYTIITLLPATVGALWLLGTVFWIGRPLNVVTVITPIFVVGLGSAYGLHFVVHYLENRERYSDHGTVIQKTMEQVGIPILLTAVTTIIGFISLVSSRMLPARQLGILSSIGVGFASLITFFFLPALLTLLKLPVRHRPHKIGARILRLLQPFHRRPYIPIALFTMVLLWGFASVPFLSVYTNPLHYLKRNSPVRQNIEFVERKMGSSQYLIGEFRLNGELSDPEYVRSIYELERRMEGLPKVLTVFSVVDILKGVYQLRTGSAEFPPSRMSKLILNMIDSTENFITDDGIIFYCTTEEWDLDATNNVFSFASDNEAIRTVTGTPILYSRLNQLVGETQWVTLTITIVGMIVVLLIVFRRLSFTVASLIPIVVSVAGIYGLLRSSGYNLNMMTVTITAVSIGVGIDYVIHFLFLARYYKRTGRKYYTTEALRFSGIPIVTNALAIVCSLFPLVFSPLRVHLQVAVVLGFAMILSALATLTLVPVFYAEGIWKGSK